MESPGLWMLQKDSTLSFKTSCPSSASNREHKYVHTWKPA